MNKGELMGNVRTKHVKLISEKLIEFHTDQFSTDFNNNKEKLDELMTFDSRKTRNKIAGYIAHNLSKFEKLHSLKITYQNPNLDKRRKKRGQGR